MIDVNTIRGLTCLSSLHMSHELVWPRHYTLKNSRSRHKLEYERGQLGAFDYYMLKETLKIYGSTWCLWLLSWEPSFIMRLKQRSWPSELMLSLSSHLKKTLYLGVRALWPLIEALGDWCFFSTTSVEGNLTQGQPQFMIRPLHLSVHKYMYCKG